MDILYIGRPKVVSEVFKYHSSHLNLLFALTCKIRCHTPSQLDLGGEDR